MILEPISDVTIALAYFAIPLQIAIFMWIGRVKTFQVYVTLGLFVAFILLCGFTHLFYAFKINHPTLIVLKVLCAIVSVMTSASMLKLIPDILKYTKKSRIQQHSWEILSSLFDDETFDFVSLLLENKVIERSSESYDYEFLGENESAIVRDGVIYTPALGYEKLVSGCKRLNEWFSSAQNYIEDVATKQIENKLQVNFMSVLSHEIRTPLFSIIASLDLVNNSSQLTDVEQRIISTARINSQMLLRTISDVLDFSKFKLGSIPIEYSSIDIIDTVHDTIMMFISRLEKHDISIFNIVEENVPQFVTCDSHRLSQVLSNLISNSVKFTSSGGNIIVRTSFSEGRLAISVHDTGVGIKQEDIGSVFKEFVQVNGVSSKQYAGSGLGLYICKQIIEKMNGAISCHSEHGSWTEFTITVPVESIEKTDAFFQGKKFRIDSSVTCIPLLQECIEKMILRCGGVISNEGEKISLNSPTVISIGGEVFYYPLSYSHIKDRFGETKKAPSSTLTSSTQHLEKVLVVDDNSDNTFFMQSYIMAINENILCDVCNDPQKCIGLIKNGGYDIVFLDIHMPPYSGVDIIKQLRREGVACKVYAFTADVMPENQVLYTTIGFDGYLKKPCTLLDVENVLSNFLEVD